MRVVIISKEKDGEKEAIGASASESQAEQYVQEEGLENCEFETVSVPTKANERIDNVYLAYKPQDGGHKVILVGYFTNRFNAQQAAQPGVSGQDTKPHQLDAPAASQTAAAPTGAQQRGPQSGNSAPPPGNTDCGSANNNETLKVEDIDQGV